VVLDMEVYTKRVLDVDLLSGFFLGWTTAYMKDDYNYEGKKRSKR
jgi:hypothetical protein